MENTEQTLTKPSFKLLQSFKTGLLFKPNDSLKFINDNPPIGTETLFQLDAKALENDVFLVTLEVKLESSNPENKEEKYYSAIAIYSGLFEIKNVSPEQFEDVARTNCATILYPFCRSALSNLLSDSVFPNTLAPVIDFFAIREQSKKIN